MSIQNVRAYLREKGFESRIVEFDVSTATVALAAEAAGVEPARIAKSLSFMLPDGPILVVMAGDRKVDNAKFKQAFHAKAKMLSHDQAPEVIGHAVGGVCPFALKPGVRVYLDDSLRRFETVYPACGSANSAIQLTCDELESAAQNCMGWVDVARQG